MLVVLPYLLLSASIMLQPQHPLSTGSARPCAAGWDSVTSEKNKRHHNAGKDAQQATDACVELASSPLEIQEYLQAFARKQQWPITEEHVTEDSWVFSRELSPEEFLKATKKTSLVDKVDWTGGSAVIHINTVQLSGGFARTIVQAEFRGYGQSKDQFAMQREYWSLDSNGSLETALTTILADHFASKH
jgi:hypothetical protein